jgi:hypothetical protein
MWNGIPEVLLTTEQTSACMFQRDQTNPAVPFMRLMKLLQNPNR